MHSKSLQKIKILHFTEAWLPKTCTWLYNQIKFLPGEVENHIVCKTIQNLDQFYLPNISSLDDLTISDYYTQKLKCRIKEKLQYPRNKGLSLPRLQLHLKLLEQVVQKTKPDILHSHFGHIGWINSELAKKYDLRHIVSFYGVDVNYIPQQDSRWFSRCREMANNIDMVLCEGPYMANNIHQLGIPKDKIKIYRLGIDLTKIKFIPRQYRRGEKLRFLIAGSFREKKGIPYAIEALGMYEKINTNFEVTIIGDAGLEERDKLEKEKILDKIKLWGLENKVKLMGYQPHHILLEEAYKHHIFVSPSVTSKDGDTEGGAPVTIIEMAASGMPIISTTHCDIPFVLSSENQKYLVEERNSQALTNAIHQLTSSNDWNRLLLTNRKFIEENLDVKTQSFELANMYYMCYKMQYSQIHSRVV